MKDRCAGFEIDAQIVARNRCGVPSGHTNPYDTLPYEGGAISLTHPLKLAAIGDWYGLAFAPVSTCRVLEIGCGDGSNLLPLADCYPEAQFHGIDLSQRHIDAARDAAVAVGLKNVSFEALDVCDFEPRGRNYDYVLAHGVFSWVPAVIRERILAVTSACLSDRGLAAISFNTYPGWRLRGMIRDLLQHHVAAISGLGEKLVQARAFLRFLATNAPNGAGYGDFLRFELKEISAFSDSYLLHEFLEGENQPFFHHQFVELALGHNLVHLGDADRRISAGGDLPPRVAKVLEGFAPSSVVFEQYTDFVAVRTFRRSVLVRKDRAPEPRSRDNSWVKRSWFSTAFRPVADNTALDSGVKVEFRNARGTTADTDTPIVKAALYFLARAAPKDVDYFSLRESLAQSVTPPAEGQGTLASLYPASFDAVLAELVERGLIDAVPEPYPCASTQETSLRVSALARYEAAHRSKVTNRRHVGSRMDPLLCWLLVKLDGSPTRASLEELYCREVESGALKLTVEGQIVTGPERVRVVARERVAAGLDRLRTLGYLVDE